MCVCVSVCMFMRISNISGKELHAERKCISRAMLFVREYTTHAGGSGIYRQCYSYGSRQHMLEVVGPITNVIRTGVHHTCSNGFKTLAPNKSTDDASNISLPPLWSAR